jgi:hypothetical protein
MTYKEQFINNLTLLIRKLDKKILEYENYNRNDQKFCVDELRRYRVLLQSKYHGREFIPPLKNNMVVNINNRIETIKLKYSI